MKTPFRTQLQNSLFLIVFPLVYILLGALLQFVPGEKLSEETLVYVIAACVVVLGLVMVTRYFLQSSFRDLYSYDFAFGFFAVIVGICMIVGADRIASDLTVLVGVFMLMTSIVKVQNAIQLISLKKKFWIPVMIVAILLIAADIVVLTGEEYLPVWKDFTHYLLMVDGAISLGINIVMQVMAHNREKALMVVPAEAPAPAPAEKEQDKPADPSSEKPSDVKAEPTDAEKNVPPTDEDVRNVFRDANKDKKKK